MQSVPQTATQRAIRILYTSSTIKADPTSSIDALKVNRYSRLHVILIHSKDKITANKNETNPKNKPPNSKEAKATQAKTSAVIKRVLNDSKKQQQIVYESVLS